MRYNRTEVQEALLRDAGSIDPSNVEFYRPYIKAAVDCYFRSVDYGDALAEDVERMVMTLRDGQWKYEKHSEFAQGVKHIYRTYYWLRQIQALQAGEIEL